MAKEPSVTIRINTEADLSAVKRVANELATLEGASVRISKNLNKRGQSVLSVSGVSAGEEPWVRKVASSLNTTPAFSDAFKTPAKSINEVVAGTAKVKNGLKDVEKAANATDRSFTRIAKGVFFTSAIYAGIKTLKASLTLLMETLKETEKTVSALNVSNGGDKSKTASDMQYIKDEANRLGLEKGKFGESFSKFANPTRAQGWSDLEVKKVFSAFSMAGKATGADNEDMKGVFKAITQIVGKDKVMSEELTGQLAEHYPTAVKAFAAALNMTTPELFEAVKKGKVTADALKDVGNKVFNDMGMAIREAANSTESYMNRFKNSLTQVAQDVGSETSGMQKNLLNKLTEALADPKIQIVLADVVNGLLRVGTAFLDMPIWGFANDLWGKLMLFAYDFRIWCEDTFGGFGEVANAFFNGDEWGKKLAAWAYAVLRTLAGVAEKFIRDNPISKFMEDKLGAFGKSTVNFVASPFAAYLQTPPAGKSTNESLKEELDRREKEKAAKAGERARDRAALETRYFGGKSNNSILLKGASSTNLDTDISSGGKGLSGKSSDKDGKNKLSKAENEYRKAKLEAEETLAKAVADTELKSYQKMLALKQTTQLAFLSKKYEIAKQENEAEIKAAQASMSDLNSQISKAADAAEKTKLEADKLKLQAKIDALKEKAKGQKLEFEVEIINLNETIAKTKESLQSELLSLDGKDYESKLVSLSRQRKERIEDTNMQGTDGWAAMVEASYIKQYQLAQLNEQEKKFTQQTSNLELLKRELELQSSNGIINSEEYLKRYNDERVRTIELLKETVAAMEAVANADNPEQLRKIRETKLQIAELELVGNEAAKSLGEAFSNAAVDGIGKLIEGTESLADVLRNFTVTVLKELQNQLAKSLSSQIFTAMGGSSSTGAFGSVLGFLGIPGFATGGYVVGPGTTTSDSIPTLLSNKEYVINAAMVDKFGKGFFDTINFGGRIDWSRAVRRAGGGLVGSGVAGGVSLPAAGQPSSITVVNKLDAGVFEESLQTEPGSRALLAAVSRNKAAVRQALGV